MWLLIVTAALLAGVLFLGPLGRNRGHTGESDAFIAMAVALFLVGIAWCIIGIVYWSFAPDQARIAEVRAATARLQCAASEDILGKATDWNVTIQGKRVWNRRWIADPFIPDGWDTTSLIVIPECR
jgi:hypothetical protein